MSLGLILLTAAGFLIFFGVIDRILDKLYLSDRTALIFIALLIAGSFVDVSISSSPRIIVNLGGAVIPVVLAVYVLSRAGSKKEWFRTILATILTGLSIYSVSFFTRDYGQVSNDLFDFSYLFIIIAGFVAYIFGRSRRGAFIAGTLGYLIYDLIQLGRVIFKGIPSVTHFGGAGVFDTMILTGIFSVLLVEIVGEGMERLQGGSKTEQREKRLLEEAGPKSERGEGE